MFRYLVIVVLVGLIGGCAAPGPQGPKKTQAQIILAGITTSYSSAPQARSLIDTAIAEARTAAEQAALAAKRPGDGKWLDQYTLNIRHAINPVSGDKGLPGLGYGVRRATKEIMRQMELAAKSPDASVALKGQAPRVNRMGKNVLGWCTKIDGLINQLAKEEQSRSRKKLLKDLKDYTSRLVEGFDKNRDGLVTWRRGEGGLVVIADHLQVLEENPNGF